MLPFDQTFSRPVALHYPREVPESLEIPFVGDYVPTYAHPGDAGADLKAAESVVLEPGARATIGTGVSIALPAGYLGFVVPRSGLASRHGITIVNSPGTVDAGYRGELRVTLLNTDRASAFSVEVGDRIAQLIVMPVVTAAFVPVQAHEETVRGTAGFGSTGYRATTGGLTE
jgi:dUTP pyrophosphatase